MVLTKTYLVGLALADAAAKANPLADLEPEAPWQICLHDPIRHASAADFVPSEAVVFDIDMSHAQDFPTMIPNLKVGLPSLTDPDGTAPDFVTRKPTRLFSATSMPAPFSPGMQTSTLSPRASKGKLWAAITRTSGI